MDRITYEQRVRWANEIAQDLRAYLPLTLRQLFYQMVAKLLIPNTESQYKGLSGALARARKEGSLDWGVIEDRTRPLYGSVGYEDQDAYLHRLLDYAYYHYERQLMKGQDYYIEIFVEKQALITPFIRASKEYALFVNMGRGYSSVTVLKEMAERLEEAEDEGYSPLVLAFSDLDPSGIDLVDNLSRQFADFGLWPEVIRIALTRGQVEEYDLPHDPKALKTTDSRYSAFLTEYGQYAVELDALDPPTLERLVHEAVQAHLDLVLFEREKKRQAKEKEEIRERVEEFFA